MTANKILVLYPPSHKHLGLFNDLKKRDDVILICSELRFIIRLLKRFLRFFVKDESKTDIFYSYKFYTHKKIFEYASALSSIIVIDGALNNLQTSILWDLKNKNNGLKFYLYMINSIDASSPLMMGVRKKYKEFAWDKIMTFDENDASKYGLQYFGFCYYSKYNIVRKKNPQFDVYFVGGDKGGRINMLYDIFETATKYGVNIHFDIYLIHNKNIVKHPEINYITNKWLSYKEVLTKVQDCKCILEVLQIGQSGASLRYFEAVCYNKKLLTTNTEISKFPYYDSRWMKVFTRIEDIDWGWVLNDDNVDYHYQGDFSPNKLVDYVKN